MNKSTFANRSNETAPRSQERNARTENRPSNRVADAGPNGASGTDSAGKARGSDEAGRGLFEATAQSDFKARLAEKAPSFESLFASPGDQKSSFLSLFQPISAGSNPQSEYFDMIATLYRRV